MKYSLLLLILVFAGCSSSTVTEVSVSESLNNQEFKLVLEDDDPQTIVLDIRTSDELCDVGTLAEDVIQLDFYAENFADTLTTLIQENPSAHYYVYCRSGNRTNQTLALMKKLGVSNISHLENGRKGWVASGHTLLAWENKICD